MIGDKPGTEHTGRTCGIRLNQHDFPLPGTTCGGTCPTKNLPVATGGFVFPVYPENEGYLASASTLAIRPFASARSPFMRGSRSATRDSRAKRMALATEAALEEP